MEFSDDPNSASYKKTRKELIDYMVTQRYPRNKVVTEILKKPKDQNSEGRSGSSGATKNYSSIVNKAEELSNFIKNPGDKYFTNPPSQTSSFPGGTKNEEYSVKLEEIKQRLRKDLNDRFAIRKIGNKKVIQDFDIAFDESTGEIRVFPKVQIPGEQGLSIQDDISTGFVLNDNNLFKFDDLLNEVFDGKTSLQTTRKSSSKSDGNVR